jgi:hypothetical protein
MYSGERDTDKDTDNDDTIYKPLLPKGISKAD